MIMFELDSSGDLLMCVQSHVKAGFSITAGKFYVVQDVCQICNGLYVEAAGKKSYGQIKTEKMEFSDHFFVNLSLIMPKRDCDRIKEMLDLT
jgi:aspartate carbamoyltransferase regulatory subunit